MLFCNNKGGLLHALPQKEIIHIVTYAEKVHQNALPFVFFDRHPIKPYSKVFNDIASLDQIDWELFFEGPWKGDYAKYWLNSYTDGKPKWLYREEIRQAEFLVHQKFPWNLVTEIATVTEEKQNLIREILQRNSVSTPVTLKPEWYF